MNKNQQNYQKQANMLNNKNSIQNSNTQIKEAASNSMSNNLSKPNEKNIKLKEQAFLSNSIKVGRNETKPVKTENGSYLIPESNVDTSFTNSKLKMDQKNFGTQLLEDQGIPEESVTVEQMQDNIENNNISNYNNQIKKEKRLKSIIIKFIIISIMIGLLVICLTSIYNYISSSKTVQTLSCTKNMTDDNNDVIIEIENLYYFKKSGNYKKEVITKYNFNTREAFNKYKNNYVDSGIYNVSGLIYENSFNTSDLSYTNVITYDLAKMRNDLKNKSVVDNKITIIDENENILVDLEILDLENTQLSNKGQGYTCTLK